MHISRDAGAISTITVTMQDIMTLEYITVWLHRCQEQLYNTKSLKKKKDSTVAMEKFFS